MKSIFSPCSVSRLVLALALAPLFSGHSAQVSPSALAVSGDVLIADKTPLQAGSIAPGADIVAKADSGAIFRPVPGQNIYLDSNSVARVVSAEVTPGAARDGGAVRTSSIRLVSGHLHSTVAPAPSGENRQVVHTACAQVSSENGSWSTWANEDGSEHAVVYAGTVMISITRKSDPDAVASTDARSVILRAGQVANWRCDGMAGGKQTVAPGEPILEVVDLRTGTVTQYLDGNQIGHRLATADDLQGARDLLLAGLPAFRGTATSDQRIEFGLILDDINEVLRDNILGGIPPSSVWFLFPNFEDLGIIFPADFASPARR